jgi:NACalpha-BTF3-like transcription factor
MDRFAKSYTKYLARKTYVRAKYNATKSKSPIFQRLYDILYKAVKEVGKVDDEKLYFDTLEALKIEYNRLTNDLLIYDFIKHQSNSFEKMQTEIDKKGLLENNFNGLGLKKYFQIAVYKDIKNLEDDLINRNISFKNDAISEITDVMKFLKSSIGVDGYSTSRHIDKIITAYESIEQKYKLTDLPNTKVLTTGWKRIKEYTYELLVLTNNLNELRKQWDTKMRGWERKNHDKIINDKVKLIESRGKQILQWFQKVINAIKENNFLLEPIKSFVKRYDPKLYQAYERLPDSEQQLKQRAESNLTKYKTMVIVWDIVDEFLKFSKTHMEKIATALDGQDNSYLPLIDKKLSNFVNEISSVVTTFLQSGNKGDRTFSIFESAVDELSDVDTNPRNVRSEYEKFISGYSQLETAYGKLKKEMEEQEALLDMIQKQIHSKLIVSSKSIKSKSEIEFVVKEGNKILKDINVYVQKLSNNKRSVDKKRYEVTDENWRENYTYDLFAINGEYPTEIIYEIQKSLKTLMNMRAITNLEKNRHFDQGRYKRFVESFEFAIEICLDAIQEYKRRIGSERDIDLLANNLVDKLKKLPRAIKIGIDNLNAGWILNEVDLKDEKIRPRW